MDTFESGDKRSARGRGKRLIVGLIFVAAIIGLGVWSSVYGFGQTKNFLRETAALVSKTLHDVLSFNGGREKLAAEIDLSQNTMESKINNSIPPSLGFVFKTGDKKSLGDELAASVSKSVGKKSAAKEDSATGALVDKNSATANLASTSVKITPTSADSLAIKICSFAPSSNPNHQVLLNEIAWMGSPQKNGETATQASNNEWLELKNNFGAPINLADWQILDDNGKFQIAIASAGKIDAGGFYLLERTSDDSAPSAPADKIYSGALSNSGMRLGIFNKQCALVDEVDASRGWPAGDNATKQTMERSTLNFGWYTSDSPGGTPRTINSNVYATGSHAPAGSSSQNSSASVQTTGQTTISDEPNQSSTSLAAASTTTLPPPLDNSGAQHVLISEIFYDAVGSDDGKEFVEFYNPTAADADLKSWSLKNGSSSLASIGSKSEDKTVIKSRGYFLVGLSNNSSSLADVVRSASLPNVSATIILFDKSGVTVDSVSYNNSVSPGQSYERSPLDGNLFVAEPNPNPQNSQTP